MESAQFIEMMASSGEPTLYWLDAHFSGVGFEFPRGIYSRNDSLRTPLGAELAHLEGRRGDVIIIDDLRIYESAVYGNGPLPLELGSPKPNGADWIRKMFLNTHDAHSLLDDEGYLLLVPR